MWLRRILIILGVLLVIAGAAYYWLMVESHVPSDTSYALDIDRVHAALETVPGDKPSAIEVEQVGVFTFPATGVVAGDGWNGVPLPVFSYRLVYPDGTRVGAGPDTVVRELQDRNGERLEIRQGAIWADVAKQAPNRPFRFLTPHGEAKVLGTALRMRIDKGTRLEVEEGKVELRNAGGKKIDVSTGQYGVAATGVELAAHPLPPLVFGDAFDGSPVNEWPKGWLKHGEGAPRSSADAVRQ